jgi:hypothetical protein
MENRWPEDFVTLELSFSPATVRGFSLPQPKAPGAVRGPGASIDSPPPNQMENPATASILIDAVPAATSSPDYSITTSHNRRSTNE